MHEGRFPAFKRGNALLVRETDLDQYIESKPALVPVIPRSARNKQESK